ncbi:hypothetical protein GCM10022409_28520 [Hymenobacter glaciei]|uniref:Uncharacterized protein n=1 Tax=Hymenobacter glaciei TaxID=877209 RepID=A0ABP7UDF8_9BACT
MMDFKSITARIFSTRRRKQAAEDFKYAEDRNRVMDSISVGKTEHMGNVVTKIFAVGDEYKVYEIKTDVISESLRTMVFPLKKEDPDGLERKFDGIRIKYSQIKGQLYKASDDTSIKTQIAHIISHALNDHVDEANESFDSLLEKIENEYQAQLSHRKIYLLTILFLVMGLITTSFIIYRWDQFPIHYQIKNLVYISAAASVGGFISVSLKIKDVAFEKDAQNILFYLYAIERVFVSVVAGVISYAAIKCKILFGIVTELENPIWGFILFAVVAGFSETLIPGLLSKLEQDNK